MFIWDRSWLSASSRNSFYIFIMLTSLIVLTTSSRTGWQWCWLFLLLLLWCWLFWPPAAAGGLAGSGADCFLVSTSTSCWPIWLFWPAGAAAGLAVVLIVIYLSADDPPLLIVSSWPYKAISVLNIIITLKNKLKQFGKYNIRRWEDPGSWLISHTLLTRWIGREC